MRRPNLFIIGAPRCGTTAMSTFLREHPNIYVPKLKEPGYFANDFPGVQIVNSLTRYMRLFERAQQEHKVLVDASVLYMYSSVAVENISRFNPRAKILLMLRNPIDLVYSIHARLLATFAEDERNFEKAWRLQPARQHGKSLPEHCLTPLLLQYREVGKLGHQVQRVLDIFPRDQVHIILFADFLKWPQSVYEGILAFLDVPSDGRTDFPRINENINSYWVNWLSKLVHHPPRVIGHIADSIKKISRIERFGLVTITESFFGKREQRQPLRTEFRVELAKEFRDDIQKFSIILGRDLSHWC